MDIGKYQQMKLDPLAPIAGARLHILEPVLVLHKSQNKNAAATGSDASFGPFQH
jgi:hypothetical protein